MEGPTPVSALIHAATMVAAGVYLLVKITFLLALVPTTREVIAWVGVVTSVLAALMATQQSDIKRILAYSTLSQLGYMVAAVGVAAGGAAMFHLFTHAFFKALLFLGAGAVIYAVHHEQNIWRMGGLRTRMPVTFWTFLLASLALMGCPFFSGFYSKDGIILALASHSPTMGALGLFVALLTAFYMMRLIMVVFINRPSSREIEHAHEVPAGDGFALVDPGRARRGCGLVFRRQLLHSRTWSAGTCRLWRQCFSEGGSCLGHRGFRPWCSQRGSDLPWPDQ